MKAFVNDTATDALVAVDLPEPEPGPGELLVDVRAAGLNRADLAARSGSRRMATPAGEPVPGLQVAGLELAGEVLALGAGVSSFQVGDRVMARGRGYAELAVVDARSAMAVPLSFSWEEAGACPVTLLTAHDALATAGRLAPGGVVLVQAATSGVGVAAVRMAEQLGASMVLATSRSAAKLQVLVDHLGPAFGSSLVCIDTSTTDVEAEVAAHTHGHGADVVIDAIGAAVLAQNLVAAALGGRIVQVGRLHGRHAAIDLDELARKRLSLTGVSTRTRTPADIAEVVARCASEVGATLERHRPRIHRSFPLTEAVEAQAALSNDEHVGKLVLVP